MDPIDMLACHEEAARRAKEEADKSYTVADPMWEECFLSEYNRLYDSFVNER